MAGENQENGISSPVSDEILRKQKKNEDEKLEYIVGLRFGIRATKVELVIGRPHIANVIWTNKVSTTKYNLINFIPKNLWEQFHIFANLYFLLCAALQMIPRITDSEGYPTILGLLIPVIIFTMLKDGYEDYNRYLNDMNENKRQATRVMTNKLQDQRFQDYDRKYEGIDDFPCEQVDWQHLRVGDVIKLSYGDAVPADVILLSTISEDGVTYVETKNLDGETNLKAKVTHPRVQSEFSVFQNNSGWLQGRVTYEGPSTQLYTFSGEIQMGGSVYPLEASQLILRGCSLQGEVAMGVVVYTGPHTRVYKNANSSQCKRSRLVGWYDRHVIHLVILQSTFCLINAALYTLYYDPSHWYLYYPAEISAGTRFEFFVIVFFRVFLIFTYFIPITLLVSLEFVRALLATYVRKDETMRVEGGGMVQVNDSGVIEDAGCVSHIFSDKTGTLTQNLMTFSAVALRGPLRVGVLFGSDEVDPDPPKFTDPKFPRKKLMEELKECPEFRSPYAYMLLVLACCHSVTIRVREGQGPSLDASSPDELALVCGSQTLGVQFTGRPSPEIMAFIITSPEGAEFWNLATGMDVAVGDTPTAEVLAVLDFDNVRKRMSTVVKIGEDIYLLSKGADSTMLAIAKKDNTEEESDLTTWLNRHLDDFSVEGLRTLVLGYRIMDPDEYSDWFDQWTIAKTQGSATVKEEAIGNCIALVEKELTICGATGVDDKLQDEVPECIRSLQDAGIKLWVLTGDKMETAINIAKSCNFITPTTYTEEFTETTNAEILQKIISMEKYLHAAHLFSADDFKLDWTKVEILEKEALLKEAVPEPPLTVSPTASPPKKKSSLATVSIRRADQQLSAFRNKVASSTSPSNSFTLPFDRAVSRSISKDSFADFPLSPKAAGSRSTFSRVLSPFVAVEQKGSQASNTRTIQETLNLGEDAELLLFDKVCIVITGDCMHRILGCTELRRRFFFLALSSCESIICCRVTPIQKSLVVTWSQLYLESQKQAMLAIGDGANDVGMILAARVGVGIQGKEGSQAARSADYVIPEFRFLKRLLFYHGREAIRRNSYLAYFVIYKNVMFCMTSFFFNWFALFSGMDHYDMYLKQIFNTGYTLLPIVFFALFDREFPADVLHRSTVLYKQNAGAALPLLGNSTMFYWFGIAFFSAAVCALIPILSMNPTIEYGTVHYLWVGHAVFLSILFPANFMIILESHKLFWFTLIVMVIGIISYFVTWALLSETSFFAGISLDTSRIFVTELRYPIFWFTVILCPVICLAPHVLFKAVTALSWTPGKQVRDAYRQHKARIRRKVKTGEIEKPLNDPYFYTRTFEPDEVIKKLRADQPPTCAALVPTATIGEAEMRRKTICTLDLDEPLKQAHQHKARPTGPRASGGSESTEISRPPSKKTTPAVSGFHKLTPRGVRTLLTIPSMTGNLRITGAHSPAPPSPVEPGEDVPPPITVQGPTSSQADNQL